jgi:putative intracellular protease/amidase
MKVLMVLTSHDKLGNSGRKTGFWYEEFAGPYYTFKNAGAEVVLASPMGGQPPLDPTSAQPAHQTEHTRRFESDAQGKAQLASTVRLSTVSHKDFDTVFYPGGHGPMWDLAEDNDSIALLAAFYAAGKPVGLVCHAPAALHRVKTADGKPLVEGKRVTGIADSEEIAFGTASFIPFMVEDELKAQGGIYSKAADWQPHVARDNLLLTGQNPASAAPAASLLLKQLAGG